MRQLTCFALAACLASPAFAQNQPTAGSLPTPEEVANKDIVTVAAGAAIVPDYEGSDDYRIFPAGAIRGKVHGISFNTRGTYLFVDVIPGNAKVDLDAGPIVGVRFNSRRKVDDDVVKLLPKRKTAIEVGGFAGVSFHGLTNPYDTRTSRRPSARTSNSRPRCRERPTPARASAPSSSATGSPIIISA